MPKKSKPLPVCVPALLFGFLNLVSLYTQMCKPGKKVGWEKQYCMGRDREGGALPTVSCLGQALKLPSSMTCPDTTWEVHGGFSFSLQYKFPAGSGSFFSLLDHGCSNPSVRVFPKESQVCLRAVLPGRTPQPRGNRGGQRGFNRTTCQHAVQLAGAELKLYQH